MDPGLTTIASHNLPPEIHIEILQHLSIVELQRLRSISRFYNKHCIRLTQHFLKKNGKFSILVKGEPLPFDMVLKSQDANTGWYTFRDENTQRRKLWESRIQKIKDIQSAMKLAASNMDRIDEYLNKTLPELIATLENTLANIVRSMPRPSKDTHTRLQSPTDSKIRVHYTCSDIPIISGWRRKSTPGRGYDEEELNEVSNIRKHIDSEKERIEKNLEKVQESLKALKTRKQDLEQTIDRLKSHLMNELLVNFRSTFLASVVGQGSGCKLITCRRDMSYGDKGLVKLIMPTRWPINGATSNLNEDKSGPVFEVTLSDKITYRERGDELQDLRILQEVFVNIGDWRLKLHVYKMCSSLMTEEEDDQDEETDVVIVVGAEVEADLPAFARIFSGLCAL